MSTNRKQDLDDAVCTSLILTNGFIYVQFMCCLVSYSSFCL